LWVLAGRAASRAQPLWKHVLAGQAAMTVGLVPLTLILFQQVSLVGPLANAVAIPLVSWAIAPLALIGIVVPPVLLLAHGLTDMLMHFLQWCDTRDWAVWQHAAPSAWATAAALFGVVWLFQPGRWRHTPWRWVGLVWMLPLWLPQTPSLAEGEASLTVLDVGQGLAAVVRTRNNALLFDTGPAYSLEQDAGHRVVLPYLRAVGVRELDAMVVSHRDVDHAGGMLSVLAEIAPSARWMGYAPQDSLAYRHCVAGQTWMWDGVEFSFLHPQEADYAVTGIKSNDMGCVLRINAGGKVALLTADIEAKSEARLVVCAHDSLRAHVLVAPHHGSKTSSTDAFLEAVKPQHAIITAGYRNRFAHPHADVVARYEARNTAIWRTDRDGAISAQLGPTGVKLSGYRSQRPRYWHGK
jgi:competence protein ComEC